MTEDDLQAINSRAEALPEGTWKPLSGMIMGLTAEQLVCSVAAEFYVEANPARIRYEDAPAIQAFIAHARTDIPALITEVRQLRALCRRGGELLNDTWYDAPAGTISAVKALAGELEVAGRE